MLKNDRAFYIFYWSTEVVSTCLVKPRDHEPAILHRLAAEFLLIPLLRRPRGDAKVDRDKGETSQECLVRDLAGWGSYQC